MKRKTYKTVRSLLVFIATFLPLFISLELRNFQAIAQTNQGVIHTPPSNIRKTPNGELVCSIEVVTEISLYRYNHGWYLTNACGNWGYIHESQLTIKNTYRNNNHDLHCYVTNTESGRLAIRKTPAGNAIAGLNKNNRMIYLGGNIPWFYVEVISSPNSVANGKRGWVNADYLRCYKN